jgi:hypothetical protein
MCEIQLFSMAFQVWNVGIDLDLDKLSNELLCAQNKVDMIV